MIQSLNTTVNTDLSGTGILVCVARLNTAPILTDKNVCATDKEILYAKLMK